MVHILDGDENNIGSCWKCLTIIGMTEAMRGYPREALENFQKAVNVVKRDTGSVPAWLTSRVETAETRFTSDEMAMLLAILGWLIFAAIIGLVPAYIAWRKGDSFLKFWALGYAFWIIAMPFAIFMKPNTAELDRRRIQKGDVRCPSCCEFISAKAVVCPHCRRDVALEGASTPANSGSASPTPELKEPTREQQTSEPDLFSHLTKHCRSCHRELRLTDNFCRHCGTACADIAAESEGFVVEPTTQSRVEEAKRRAEEERVKREAERAEQRQPAKRQGVLSRDDKNESPGPSWDIIILMILGIMFVFAIVPFIVSKLLE
jgi:hypothetical protein